MTLKAHLPLPLAAAALVLFTTPATRVQAQTVNVQKLSTANAPTAGQAAPADAANVASQMVRAQAELHGVLDARRVRPGYAVRATLTDSVQLKNGQQLERGTALAGTVCTDSTAADRVRIALCFTRAKLKDGTTLPIEATIVGFYPPKPLNQSISPPDPADHPPNLWSPSTLQVDQTNVLPGIDLHSRIAGATSGVFVSDHKGDVKIDNHSQIELALAPATAQQNADGASGGK